MNNAIIEHGENWSEILLKVYYQTNAKLNPFVNVWNTFEIKRFEAVFKEFGNDWKVAKFIGTKSPIQCYTYWKRQGKYFILIIQFKSRMSMVLLIF